MEIFWLKEKNFCVCSRKDTSISFSCHLLNLIGYVLCMYFYQGVILLAFVGYRFEDSKLKVLNFRDGTLIINNSRFLQLCCFPKERPGLYYHSFNFRQNLSVFSSELMFTNVSAYR